MWKSKRTQGLNMIGLIGKKIGMAQVFDSDGRVVPVTVIKAGPCKVICKRAQYRKWICNSRLV